MTRSATPSAPFTRDEWILIALAAFLAFALHWHFRLSGFGEQDAARLATDALDWHFAGPLDMAKVDYRLRTSPLYIHGLKLALDCGLAVRSLPAFMNGFSVLASSAGLVGLYLLFRQLSTPAVSAAATFVYSFTPCFWLGSIYGMPTLPALTLLVFSALCLGEAAAADELRSRRFAGFLALSTLLAALAISLKADIALSSGVLLLPLIARDRLRPALLACIPLIVGIGALFTLGYANHLARPVLESDNHDSGALSSFWQSWSARFPFNWSLLIDPRNNAPITHAAGTLLFAVCVVALCHGVLGDRKRRWLTLGVAIWGLTPLLFWGFKIGNSARHNLPAFPALVFLAISMLFQLVENNTKRAWFLIGMLLAAGQLDRTGANVVTPPVDVFRATELVKQGTKRVHLKAREFLSSPAPKKAFVETEYLFPYAEYEAWAAAEAPTLSENLQTRKTISDGPNRETLLLLTSGVREAKTQARSLRRHGFKVISLQFSL